jgi:hypothetical protein
MRVYRIPLPDSEIHGSKVARHLPEAYRSHAASFIASISQGILHLPLNDLFELKVKCWLTINNHKLLIAILSCQRTKKPPAEKRRYLKTLKSELIRFSFSFYYYWLIIFALGFIVCILAN